MKLRELCSEFKYECLSGSMDVDVRDVIYDSRKITEGTVFVCMVGAVTDGHKYIPDAVKKGASAIVVERADEAQQIPDQITVIQVESARRALAYMSAALFGHPDRKLVTIGITGTKGKTTTTYMIKSVLEMAGKKVGLIGTIGAMIGDEHIPSKNTTPESYELHRMFAAMVEAGCEYVVMEVSSQGLKLDRTAGILFDYGVFTNISPDHIGPGEHKDFAEYLSCKAKLFEHCKVGIINKDDSHYEDIIKNATCKLLTFGVEKEADVKGNDIEHVTQGGDLSMKFHASGLLEGDVVVGLPGRFNIYNALCAACTGVAMNMPKEVILHALEHVKVRGRVEAMPVSDEFSVLIDFAHNGVSSESVLSTLREYKPNRIIAVFGCGGNRSKVRRYEMGEVIGKMCELAVITSDNPRREDVMDIIEDIKVGMAKSDGNYVVIPDREEAVAYALEHAEKGDMIVLLGKGHEEYQEINGVKHHYSEREAIVHGMKKIYGKDFTYLL